MNIKHSDTPKGEVLDNVAHSLETNYQKLIPFREKYATEEIIEYLTEHEYFIKDVIPSNISPFSDEYFSYVNPLKSLITTWDLVALNAYKKIILCNPGMLTLKNIVYIFMHSDFPNRKLLLDFIKQLQKEFPQYSYLFEETVEMLEIYISANRPSLVTKRAISPEERESI